MLKLEGGKKGGLCVLLKIDLKKMNVRVSLHGYVCIL